MDERTVIPVSVIIPTYNRAQLVGDAVTSVLNQRCVKPREIIVVDDGSSDETPQRLAQFADVVRYVVQEHRGVSAARNRGITISTGEWVAFLDSDDYWLPEKLLHHWRFCLASHDMLLSQTDEIWLQRGHRRNPKKYHEKPSGYCFERLLVRCLVSPSAAMVHRSIFDRVGLFDERLPACEDYDFWLRVGYRYPLGLVARKLVVKRGGRDDQLSSTVPCLDRYRIASIVKLLIRERLTEEQRAAALAVLAHKCSLYAQGALKRGRSEEGHLYHHLVQRVLSGTIDEVSLLSIVNGEKVLSR